MTRLTEGRGIVDKFDLDGLELSIEVEAGGTRTGTNAKGERWENKVSASYGYIRGTNSPDGESLDVWVKKNPKEGKQVYVIHQLTPDGSKYDEDKVMLGYSSRDEAVKAFKDHAFKPREMFGGVSEFNIEHFKVIAYAARKSKVMIASQKMYDEFAKKKLLPKGIKSPIELSKVVKEGADMGLQITYKNMLVAESALELAHANQIPALKSNLNVIFESEADLRKFIKMIDESQEDQAHLGDLHEMLPETIEPIMESNLSDAIDDLKMELRVDDGDVFAVADEIARDYGLDVEQLIKTFEKAEGVPIEHYAEKREAAKAATNADSHKLATMHPAAKKKLIHKIIWDAVDALDHDYPGASNRELLAQPELITKYLNNSLENNGIPKEDRPYLQRAARELVGRGPEFWNQGRPAMEGLNSEPDFSEPEPTGLPTTTDSPFTHIERDPLCETDMQTYQEAAVTVAEILKSGKTTSAESILRQMASQKNLDINGLIEAFTDLFGYSPEDYLRKYTFESMDSLLKLAGIKTTVLETQGTPLVHTTRGVIKQINETTNNAIASYMVNFAAKKQRALMESVQPVDMDAALRRFANTLLAYPKAPVYKVLEAVADKLLEGNQPALRNHVSSLTGLSVEEFAQALALREWSDNKLSKTTMDNLMEATDAKWSINCPDRGAAFMQALKGL